MMGTRITPEFIKKPQVSLRFFLLWVYPKCIQPLSKNIKSQIRIKNQAKYTGKNASPQSAADFANLSSPKKTRTDFSPSLRLVRRAQTKPKHAKKRAIPPIPINLKSPKTKLHMIHDTISALSMQLHKKSHFHSFMLLIKSILPGKFFAHNSIIPKNFIQK